MPGVFSSFGKDRIPWRKQRILLLISTVLLGIGLLVGLILVQQKQEIRKKAAEDFPASLTLASGAVNTPPKIGDIFPVQIYLNSKGKKIAAVDIILKYPADKLEIVDADNDDSNGFQVIQPAEIYPQGFPKGEGNKANNAQGIANISLVAATIIYNSSGEISDVNLIPEDQLFSGPGLLGTLKFKAKTAGSATIAFAFETTGVTTDTNVVDKETAEDILGTVNSLTINIQSEPNPSPTPPSAEKASLSFSIKFQGIFSAKSAKKVKITLKKEGANDLVFDNVKVTANDQGVYSGTVDNINPGTYTVLLKGPSHLQKNFGFLTLTAGQSLEKNWTEKEIKVGDVNNDNKLTIEDVVSILSLYTDFSVPVEPGTIQDVNGDDKITVEDIVLVLSNYTDFTIPGDE